MQRVRFPGNHQTLLEEVPVPRPLRDEILVRVRASALCGSDLHSLYRPMAGSPFTPGHEVAGDVVAIDGAMRVRVGDRVALHAAVGCGSCPSCHRGAPIMCPSANAIGFRRDGGDARYILVPERACLPLPDSVSYEVAALIGDGVGTPFRALSKAGGVRGGQTVGIFGLGPMGLGATLLGCYFGATVIGVDINAERLALARSLGASYTLDARESDVPAAVHELTNGRGLDIAMECAGSDTTLQYALESIGHFGHIALVGEHRQATINPSAHFLGHELTMTGTRYYHVSDYADVLQLIADGLRPDRIITHRFALADAPQALQLFDLGQTAKVMLLP